MNESGILKQNKVELLSPAGDYECFIAALSAGADAVYLSGQKFGARAYAKNFTDDEVIKAIDTAHLYGKKVYLTVNTLLKDDELEGLYDYILPFYEAGLDSVIVQDMGVISFINDYFPGLNIHASTQLAITGAEGVKLLETINVKRTVLARELSLDEIKAIKKDTDCELECFIHGALCYSYSGKCLLSSLIGGRSGNRGRCAGTCRQPYNGKYPLSTKDICTLAIIPELIGAGITSFKIEGRMKSPGYVYGVTSIYRKYIDCYFNNSGARTDEEIKQKLFSGMEFENDMQTLEKLYTRGGHSEGYYYKNNGADMISFDDASYKSDIEESPDTFITPLERLKITGDIHIKTGEPAILKLKYNSFEAEATGNIVEMAGKAPVDEATVKRQLFKTGDSAFEFVSLSCDISPDAFIRIGDINALRRDALSRLTGAVLKCFRRTAENKESSAGIFSARVFAPNENGKPHKCIFTADICTYEQLKAVMRHEVIKRIYIPYSIVKNENTLINQIKNSGKEVYIKFQPVIRNGFLSKNADEILNIVIIADGVLTDNNELLYFLKNAEYDKPVVADIHLYCLNALSRAEYSGLGINRFTVPIELNKHELYERGYTGEELIIYGYIPAMVSAQCVNKLLFRCDKIYKTISLKDRKNASFTCVNDCETCTNTVYNSVPVSLHDEDGFINTVKPESLKICLTTEDESLSDKILAYFTENKTAKPPYELYTKGHLNRGVL